MYAKCIVPILVLLVVALSTVQQSQADQLPVKPKLNIIFPPRHRIIHRLPPLGPRTTTVASLSTPSMVDVESWNFTNPSAVAKDCFNAMGKSIVDYCQAQAVSDWDPSRLNTSTTTTWESCCSLFEELDCYVKNAKTFCPASTQQAVVKYSRKVAYYMHYSICQSISFIGWKRSCNNATHAANVARHNKTLDHNPNLKPKFVKLPKDDGPETACFNKLRHQTSVNLEQRCQNISLTKWDPNHRKFMDAPMVDSCCSIYQSLDCIQREAKNGVCNSNELKDLDNYRKKSLAVFSQSICKTVPYEQSARLCGGSLATLPSIVTMFAALVTFFKIHY